MKLVSLLQLFASPRYLYSSPAGQACVGLLLEAMNNVIQYQYSGRCILYSVYIACIAYCIHVVHIMYIYGVVCVAWPV